MIIWSLANFAVILLTLIMFNSLKYWIFLIFAATNAIAGIWTYVYLLESGGRSSEENQWFFDDAKEAGTWRVNKVKGGMFTKLPYGGELNAETTPLLSRVEISYRETGEVIEGGLGFRITISLSLQQELSRTPCKTQN